MFIVSSCLRAVEVQSIKTKIKKYLCIFYIWTSNTQRRLNMCNSKPSIFSTPKPFLSALDGISTLSIAQVKTLGVILYSFLLLTPTWNPSGNCWYLPSKSGTRPLVTPSNTTVLVKSTIMSLLASHHCLLVSLPLPLTLHNVISI